MVQPQSDDAEMDSHNNISLEEIKASAPRLEMADMDEPEDHCIICLQPVEDRTVLPNCAHDRMCFECIKKWTEQSRRCPLCNTPIGSHLIHRIRSEYDYQKHYLEPLRTSPPPQQVVAEARAGYRARTRRPSQVEQDILERAIEKRRWVYRYGLFAKHIASNSHTRFRPNPTPSQISNSAELQSRCQMFVRRELRVWPNLDVEFLTSFILSLAKSIDIRTESAVKLISEFLDINGRPSPSGGTVAEHFVHELYSYLRSPFRDLTAYDAVAQYDTPDDIEPPPTTASRSNTHQQNEAGSSRRRDGPIATDDPLDASPRDADSNSEMDMDEHWVEVPPSRRNGPGWGRGESTRENRSGRRDGRDDGPRSSRQDRSRGRYRESPRRDRERSRDRDESRYRRERSPTLGREMSPPSSRDKPPPRRNKSPPSPRRNKSPPSREIDRLSRDEPSLPGRNKSLESRTGKSPGSRRDKDTSRRDREPRGRDRSGSPSPTRDRKGKRRADEYERRDRDHGRRESEYERRERDYGRQGNSDEGRNGRGKDREVHERSRRHDEMKERGASEGKRGPAGYQAMPRDNDERRWKDNDEREWRDDDAQTHGDNSEQKGKYNARNRCDDERGSAAQFWDQEKTHHRRFSGSSRRYNEQRDASPDQGTVRGDYNQQQSYSSRDRPVADDNDPHSPRRPNPHEERISYKSGRATSPQYNPDSLAHTRPGSHEPNRRPSKRTRSPSPKSKREGSGRDQKRPTVVNQHADNHSADDSRRSHHSRSTSSENIRSYDAHGVGGGTQQPRSSTRGTQTRSPSPSRRPAAYHNVQEPKTPEVERSGTAHHTVHTPFGLTSPGLDQTLSTQPGDNLDKTSLHTRDKTQLDARYQTRTDNRNRAPRLSPLASIRAHLQGASRSSEPSSEGHPIKGSPTRSTTQLESSATNYSSTPGPTLLPSAVEKSSMALNDTNTNPIQVNPASDGSSVSYSILGAAARSQAQPLLFTASPDSTQRVCPDSTVGRNRLLLARLEAMRAATNSDVHASHLSAKSPASPTVPDTSGNQSATNSEHDDGQVATSQIGQLGGDPADVNAPAARFQVERRLKLQARLAARKREINAVMDAKEGTPL